MALFCFGRNIVRNIRKDLKKKKKKKEDMFGRQ
jgi:hypothetical protein